MSRPLVGLDEEPSELERLCLAARRQVEDQSAAEEDYDNDEVSSSSNTEDWEAEEQGTPDEEKEIQISPAITAVAAAAQKMSKGADPMEMASSSCRSSGTLLVASGSYELSFDGSGPLMVAVDPSPSPGQDESSLGLLHPSNSSRSREDLLFDLEEERGYNNGLGAATAVLDPCTPRTVARLPTAFKPTPMLSPGGYSSIGETASLSFSPLPQHLPPFGFHQDSDAAGHPASPDLLPAVTLPPMARSMAACGPEGIWQHAKQHAERYIMRLLSSLKSLHHWYVRIMHDINGLHQCPCTQYMGRARG